MRGKEEKESDLLHKRLPDHHDQQKEVENRKWNRRQKFNSNQDCSGYSSLQSISVWVEKKNHKLGMNEDKYRQQVNVPRSTSRSTFKSIDFLSHMRNRIQGLSGSSSFCSLSCSFFPYPKITATSYKLHLSSFKSSKRDTRNVKWQMEPLLKFECLVIWFEYTLRMINYDVGPAINLIWGCSSIRE